MSKGRICQDELTCSHTEIEVADPTGGIVHLQYINTGRTSTSIDPVTLGKEVARAPAYMIRTRKAGIDPQVSRSRGGHLTRRPPRRWAEKRGRPGAGIMEADDRQVTTVQPSFHHRHSTNRVSRGVTIVGERAVTPHLCSPTMITLMILGLSSADGGMTVGLSSLDGRRLP